MKVHSSTDGGRITNSTDGGQLRRATDGGRVSQDGIDGGRIWGFGPIEIISPF